MTAEHTAIEHLVVVGGGLAGIRACEAARHAGHTGRITLIGDEEHLPYDRPPLSKELILSDECPTVPQLRDRDYLLRELNVDFWTSAAATGLDIESHTLATAVGEIGYDALIVACGARARQLPGSAGVRGIRTVRTFSDAQHIWQALQSDAKVVVIGAGFIGAEVASAARKFGHPVTIVEAAPAPLTRSLGVGGGALCVDLHAQHGTELILGAGVRRLRIADSGELTVTGVHLTDGRVLDADLVVVGVGAIPATEWLAGSGVALDPRDGGVQCTETLAVLGTDGNVIPGLWAAGDLAHWPNALFDRRMRLEHWTSAAEQGAVAARNALDPDNARAYETVPYFWSDWYGTRLQFVGVAADAEMVVQRRTDKTGGTVALYREGETLSGVLTVGRPDLIMKYRRLVSRRAPWDEGVAFGAAHC